MTTQSPASEGFPRADSLDLARTVTVEREMSASADQIYEAWTERFELWFARPGSVRMRAEAGEPFFFETEHEGRRHPHYGRFLQLDPARRVELTWMTGSPGTNGAETVVRLDLTSSGAGTLVRLTHSGLSGETDAIRHREAWPQVLAHLDEQLAT
jgi:uncharacterized protein YndB with AHSA1/START domain